MLAAVVAAAVGLVACTAGGSLASPTPRGPAVIVFTQSGVIWFADASGHTWGGLKTAQLSTQVVWSADGKRAAWIDKTGLHIVDARTAHDASQPCPCTGLARLGDEFATMSSDGSDMLLFDAKGRARRVRLDLPSDETPYSSIVAGGSTEAIVAVNPPDSMHTYRGQVITVAVDVQGHPHDLLPGDSLTSAAGGYTSPDGSQTALIDSPSDGACWTTPGIYALDDTTNAASQAAYPQREQRFVQAALDSMRTISGVNWAGRQVVVTYGPNDCQPGTSGRYLTYSLQNGRWKFLRNGVSAEGFGAQGRSYAIELGNPVAVAAGLGTVVGTLVLTSDTGVRTVLGRGVDAFWATPADQAAGSAKTGSASTLPVGTSDHGAPLNKAYTALADRIRSALTNNDTAAFTALCAQCDPGTRRLLGSADGRARLLRSLKAHPAVQDGSLTYPGMAVNYCYDAAPTARTCTPQQLQDIGTLGLPYTFTIDDDIGGGTGQGYTYAGSVLGSVQLTLGPDGSAHWVGQSTSALWSDKQLLITPQSLGAVRVGMTQAQAEAAAGMNFDGSGDGAAYSTTAPNGYPHLYVHAHPKVNCFGAQGGDGAVKVVTAKGFTLGSSVQNLLDTYGSRARPFTDPAGISPGSGYIVSSPDGDLVFTVDQTKTFVDGIIAGFSGVDSTSCSG
jgi:hypothetical protein